MNIKLKIDGRDASPDRLGSAVEDAVLAKIKEQLTQKLSGLRCPEHNQVPTLEFGGNSLSDLKLQIRSCCQSMREEAQRRLSQK